MHKFPPDILINALMGYLGKCEESRFHERKSVIMTEKGSLRNYAQFFKCRNNDVQNIMYLKVIILPVKLCVI